MRRFITASPDRRTPTDRRHSILRALWRSSFARRRRGPRRRNDQPLVMTDWMQPHRLATAMSILILCSVDALMTLALVSRGAVEINPLMEPLVHGSGHSFALWKLGLTSMGVLVLTISAQLRIFGGLAVGNVLNATLAGYFALVSYECWLLRVMPA
jgi:hypothetical protein